MVNLISMLAFACSVIAASIKLIEWFLSEQQKHGARTKAGEIAGHMGRLKQQQIAVDFGAGTPQVVLGILALTLTVIFMSSVYAGTRASDPEIFWTFVVSLLFSIVLIAAWLLPSLQNFISKNRGMDGYGWTVFRVWFGMVLIYAFWMIVVYNLQLNATGRLPLPIVFLDVLFTTGRNTVLAMIYLILLAKLTILIKPTVFAGEVVARRIADSPQGPLLAIAGLSSALGSFLKLFVAD
jgi:hypothetical protein